MAPRFLVSGIEARATVVTLPSDEAHHLVHVLRLAAGDEVSVFDGAGREWVGRVASVGRGGASVEIVREATPVAEPPVRITLAIGLLKADEMDAVVRDAVMLGVSAIVPMRSAHVAVSKRAERRDVASRWQRIAVSSAKQCRRAVVPAIAPLTPFDSVLALEGFDVRLMAVEPTLSPVPGRPPRGHTVPSRPNTALLLVGPEGGWSSDELDRATRQGAVRLEFGPRTIRADAAPTVALTSLWTNWGWT